MKKRILTILLAAAMMINLFQFDIQAVTRNQEESPYRVSIDLISVSQELKPGDRITVRITVDSDWEDVTTYSSYDLKLSYDDSILVYESCTAADSTAVITQEDGQLRVKGYGKDKSFRTAVATVVFVISEKGEADISVTEARIDESDNAGLRNAPLANVETAVLTVDSNLVYQVTLDGEGLKGNPASVSDGLDYSFRVDEPQLYRYEFNITSGGVYIADKLVRDDANGIYTIASEHIQGDIKISTTRMPKSFKVSLGAGYLSGDSTATYLTDYSFTLSRETGYLYTVSVTIGGKAYTGYSVRNDVYIIPGSDVTGDIQITAARTQADSSRVNVTFTGSGAMDAIGDSSAAKGSEYLFKVNQAQGFSYSVSVSVGGYETVCHYDGQRNLYYIPGGNVTDHITVTVTKTASLEVTEYLNMGQESMYLILYYGSSAPKYEGSTMYWSESYGAYAWLVCSEGAEQDVRKEAEGSLNLSGNGAGGKADYSGDVDRNLYIDEDDVQMVQDLYNVRYTLEDLGVLKFLNGDLNGDKKLDILDAAALVSKISG